MTEPLFSVILTTYNRPEFLKRAVASVLAQTLDDWELLVVDDAGPQPVHLNVRDKRVRVVRRTDNGGLAASRNTGIVNAEGRFVTFLDDDDLYLPDRLEMVMSSLDRSPVVVCWSRYFFERSNPSGSLLSGNVHHRILNGITPHAGATTLRRNEAIMFDESYPASQDVEWWIRLSDVVEVATVPRIGYLIRQHHGVRHLNTRRARIEASIRMLEHDHKEYFGTHTRAASFRWKRVGIQAMSDRDFSLASNAFALSFGITKHFKTFLHLLRSIIGRWWRW